MTASRSLTAIGSSTNARTSGLLLLVVAACASLAGCEASDDGGFSTGGGATSNAGGSGGSAFAPVTSAGTFSPPGGGLGGSGSFGAAGNPSTGGTGGSSAIHSGGAGAGGVPSLAGASGGGGLAPVGCGISTGADALIDDFEDSNSLVAAVDARTGTWENFDDTSLTGSYAPKFPSALEGRDGSVGYCVTVKGYSEWGANLVANMSAPKCGYDASAYKGVCFWAKGSVEAGGPIIFAVGTSDTVPETSGGKCVTGCNSHYQLKLTGEHELTDAYKEYCVEWAALALPSVPQPKAMDSKAIVQMEWKFPAGAGESTDGQICIDDVRFLQ